MLGTLCLLSVLATDMTVGGAVVGGSGVGLSPNSTTVYLVPVVAAVADLTYDRWFVGGGAHLVTFFNPQFPTDSVIAPLTPQLMLRAGGVLVDGDDLDLRLEAALHGGIFTVSVDDGGPGPFFGPALGASTTLRAEVPLAGGVNLQLGAGLFAVYANFGVPEFVPNVVIGLGWRSAPW